jgi:DnaK suppressor protein
MPHNGSTQKKKVDQPLEMKEYYPEFSKILFLRQEELLKQVGLTRAYLDQQVMDAPGDTADESIVDLNADYFLKLAQQHQQELTEIRNAFERMHRGIYGVCRDCESPIALERLRHLPYASCCVSCQSLREKKWLKSV